jgi:hypothetical protein
MKKLALLLVFCVIAFAGWTVLQPSNVFTVEMKDGRRIQGTNLLYSPLIGIEDIAQQFSLHNDFAHARIPTNLEGVERIDVLSDDGTMLRVTFQSGYVVEGTRRMEHTYPVVADYIKGNCDKYELDIPVKKIASITRGWKGEEQ